MYRSRSAAKMVVNASTNMHHVPVELLARWLAGKIYRLFECKHPQQVNCECVARASCHRRDIQQKNSHKKSSFSSFHMSSLVTAKRLVLPFYLLPKPQIGHACFTYGTKEIVNKSTVRHNESIRSNEIRRQVKKTVISSLLNEESIYYSGIKMAFSTD